MAQAVAPPWHPMPRTCFRRPQAARLLRGRRGVAVRRRRGMATSAGDSPTGNSTSGSGGAACALRARRCARAAGWSMCLRTRGAGGAAGAAGATGSTLASLAAGSWASFWGASSSGRFLAVASADGSSNAAGASAAGTSTASCKWGEGWAWVSSWATAVHVTANRRKTLPCWGEEHWSSAHRAAHVG